MSQTNYESTQPPGPRLFTAFFALAVVAACVAALVFLLTPHERAARASFIAPFSTPAQHA